MLERDRIGEDHFTDSAPHYGAFSRKAKTSIGVAAGLIAATLALMWLFRGTAVADWAIWLYRGAPLAPWAGIVVFGAALTGGRYFGIRAAVSENYGLALFASGVVALAYAAFGAGVLSLYPGVIHAEALGITIVLTVLITVGAAVLVFTTGHDFSRWDRYSGLLMVAGVIVWGFGIYGGGTQLLWLGFGIILLGWIVDLVYEIYMVSDANRSPVANGIGVYVAFMGVFIHLLQLVLRMLSETE